MRCSDERLPLSASRVDAAAAIRSKLPGPMRTSLTIAFSSGINVACFFVRSIVLARLIGPHDFGVAVVMLSVYAAAEMLTDMGWEKYLVSSSDDPRRSQTIVHSLRLGLGGVMAVATIMLAAPIAHLIDVPAAAPAIAALSVPMLIRCLTHMDYKALQRDFRYTGEASVESARGIFDLLGAIAFGLLLGDYWAMAGALTCGAVAACIVSHALARQRYRLGWSAGEGGKIWRFGRPLMANGLMLYAAGQSDRFIVGALFSPATLASYSAGLSLIAGPQAVANRAIALVTLPRLSHALRHGGYRSMFARTGYLALGSGLVITIPIALLGPALVPLVYGPGFHPDPLVLVLLCVAQSMIILRSWIDSALIARGLTNAVPFGNLPRIAGVAAGTAFAATTGDLVAFAACIAMGELSAFVVNAWSHARAAGRPPLRFLGAFGGVLAFWAFVAGGMALLGPPTLNLPGLPHAS